MSADSCDESFLSVGSEVREVAAEEVDKHGDEMDCNVKMEVTFAQNNLNSTVKEEKKNKCPGNTVVLHFRNQVIDRNHSQSKEVFGRFG